MLLAEAWVPGPRRARVRRSGWSTVTPASESSMALRRRRGREVDAVVVGCAEVCVGSGKKLGVRSRVATAAFKLSSAVGALAEIGKRSMEMSATGIAASVAS